MGQKIHPLGFRLGTTQNHLSLWFSSSKLYPQLLQEDYEIRQYLGNQLANAAISQISIYRKFNQIEIVIYSARPGIIVGQGAERISSLRQELEHLLGKNKSIRFNVVEIKKPDKDAALIATFITKKLEKRVVFRKAVRQALMRSQQSKIKGIKIQVSGRLNGAEIARTEWVREGRVPLQTLRANIDYSYKTAHTTYGILGVKVWIFKGEVLPN
uniref:Small ribosomal subunit protein uS3c n=1 Tax=Bulboplastis apyrenoidosa TaxID=1070855 RepID=A0A1Y9TMB0_9RHOD|nr:30S ribosomal protein S3 [Bulboplastis apyrenoidosa]ARO90778.1 30S ribosomal protein S3 [Bulboplastis apyrenoidosa]